jgi:hypothetical protein
MPILTKDVFRDHRISERHEARHVESLPRKLSTSMGSSVSAGVTGLGGRRGTFRLLWKLRGPVRTEEEPRTPQDWRPNCEAAASPGLFQRRHPSPTLLFHATIASRHFIDGETSHFWLQVSRKKFHGPPQSRKLPRARTPCGRFPDCPKRYADRTPRPRTPAGRNSEALSLHAEFWADCHPGARRARLRYTRRRAAQVNFPCRFTL